MTHFRIASLIVLFAAAGAASASAQTIGTFRWQLRPYCNVLTVTITQVGSLYRVEGRDDRCGATQAGSVIGTAFVNPDGSVGLGLNVVSVPNGQPQPVAAAISLASLSGNWSGGGTSGEFVFTPGAGNGGSLRPDPPTTTIPSLISLRNDGGFLAGGQLTVGTIPASGAGPRMMWHPAKAAFRAGSVTASAWDDANTGQVSAAFNLNTRAIGLASFAANANSLASGNYSFAIGFNTVASGAESTATGSSTTASGDRSLSGGVTTTASGAMAVALGQGTNAVASHSVALGLNTSTTGAHALSMGNGTIASGIDSLAGGASSQANGFASMAFGQRALAGGDGSVVLGSDALALTAAPGTFIFGDRSTTADLTAFIPNQFLVRAAGGVGFYTNSLMNIGVELAPSGSQWAAVSDVNAKHLFRELDGEEVLAKLARMPIQEWSYKAQDAAIRHVGPTAQDFKAAFGLGEYDLRIGTVDADGIALRAIQALEARTQSLQRENRELRERLAALEARMAAATSARERR